MSRRGPRRPVTWEDIYYRHIRAGDDPAYAIYAADEWKRRQERKRVNESNITNPQQGKQQATPEEKQAVADEILLKQALRDAGVSWPPANRAERRRLASIVRKAQKQAGRRP